MASRWRDVALTPSRRRCLVTTPSPRDAPRRPRRLPETQNRRRDHAEIRTEQVLGVHELVLLRDALGQSLSVVDHEQHALLERHLARDRALGVELRPQLLELLLKGLGLLRRDGAEVFLDFG